MLVVTENSINTVALDAALPAWLDRDAFPFRPRRLKLPSGTLSYVDEGQGELVLLVHGTPTWSFEYRHWITRLAKTHRVVAFDHLGFGLSERPSDFAFTPEAHARNLQAAVDALGLSHFTLVVHDFGGPIGLPLVFEAKNCVRRVVLLNTWMWPLEDEPSLARIARVVASPFGRFLYRYANLSLRWITPSAYGDRKKLTPAIHRQYLEPFRDRDARERVLWTLGCSLLGSSAHYAALWQRRAQLAELPVLIAWGLKDGALPPHFLKRWQAALPNAETLSLPGAGHWPHEEEPQAVLDAVARFLRHTGR